MITEVIVKKRKNSPALHRHVGHQLKEYKKTIADQEASQASSQFSSFMALWEEPTDRIEDSFNKESKVVY